MAKNLTHWTARVDMLVGPLKPNEYNSLAGRYSKIREWARDRGLEHRLPPPPPPELDLTIKHKAKREAELQQRAIERAKRRAKQ